MDKVPNGTFGIFPPEVEAHILSFLNVSGKQTVALVCKSWKYLVYKKGNWQSTTAVIPLKFDPSLIVSLKERGVTKIKCPRITKSNLDILFANHHEITHFTLGNCSLDVTDAFLRRHFSRQKKLVYLSLQNSPLATDKLLKLSSSSLKNLKTLNLEGCCKVTDEGLCRLLQYLPQLSSLDLGNCSGLTETCLEDLAIRCSKVTSLKLDGCDWLTTFGIVNLVSSFPSLNELVISDLYDHELEIITGSLKELKHLEIKQSIYSAFPTLSPRCLTVLPENCQQLEVFKVQFGVLNSFDAGSVDILMYSVSELINLRVLDIQGGLNITSLHLSHLINKLPNLTSLVLHCRAFITDQIARMLSCELIGLRHLEITESSITSEGFFLMTSGLGKLHSLSLSNINVNEESFEKSSPFLKNLKCLNLSNSYSLDDRQVKHVIKGVPFLTELTLSGCEAITDRSLSYLARYTPLMTYLDLGNCKGLSDKGMKEICNLVKLDVLKIYGVPITEEAFINICKTLQNLQFLNVLDCYKISDKGLIKAVRYLGNLEQLYISGGITDQGLIEASKHLHGLTHFFTEGYQITARGIESMLKNCPFMVKLVVEDSPMLTRNFVHQIMNRIPTRAVIYV